MNPFPSSFEALQGKDRENAQITLSIVHGIVQEHHGTISCISEPGQGTTFTLLFPEEKG